jgi:hypothetical protein
MRRRFGTTCLLHPHTWCVYSCALKMVVKGLFEQKVLLIRLHGVTFQQMAAFRLTVCRILNLTNVIVNKVSNWL